MLLYTTSHLYRSPGRFDSVMSLVWSPNGKHLVVAYDAGTVCIWDRAMSQQVLLYQGHSEQVYTVTWSPDGKYIASASEDRTVQVWDAASGKTRLTYRGHSQAMLALAWSPDGKYIASGSDEERGLQVWRARTGVRLWNNQNHASSVNVLAWGPDSSLLAGGSENGVIKIWHIPTGKKVRTYEGHVIDDNDDGFKGVYDLIWSPDGTCIASVAGDETVQVWNTESGQTILTIPSSSSSITWMHDGMRLAGRGSGKNGKGRAVIWDAKTGQQLFTHHYWSQPCVFAYSPDGTILAIGHSNGTIRLLEEVQQSHNLLQTFWLRWRG